MADSNNILFINAIRTDLPSGGMTSTQVFIKHLRSRNKVSVFSLQPFLDGLAWKELHFLLSFPVPFLVFVNRILKLRALEFFLRFSPIYFLWLIYMRIIHKPRIVIFNHHASYIYSFIFWRVKKIFVWHDLPNLKERLNSPKRGLDRLLALKIERLLFKIPDVNFSFSFSEKSFIQRFYKREAYLLPVVNNELIGRHKEITKNRLLLIGNWNRPENYEGALKFFVSYAEQCQKKELSELFEFHVAGSGAEGFVKRVRGVLASPLMFRVTERYEAISDFDELALLAPIDSGAGIKLKTLEAWSASIPVLGTQQAFSGLPQSVWKAGGVRIQTIEDLAKLCSDMSALITTIDNLTPGKAFSSYQKKIEENSTGNTVGLW
jgi:hypothetical protein